MSNSTNLFLGRRSGSQESPRPHPLSLQGRNRGLPLAPGPQQSQSQGEPLAEGHSRQGSRPPGLLSVPEASDTPEPSMTPYCPQKPGLHLTFQLQPPAVSWRSQRNILFPELECPSLLRAQCLCWCVGGSHHFPSHQALGPCALSPWGWGCPLLPPHPQGLTTAGPQQKPDEASKGSSL